MRKLLFLTLLLAAAWAPSLVHGQIITQQQVIQWQEAKPFGTPPFNTVWMYFDPTSGNLTCVNSSGSTTPCSSIPTTNTANQCLLSTGSGSGAVWGSCSGTTSTNWSAIVPGTGTITTGTYNIGSGSTLATVSGATLTIASGTTLSILGTSVTAITGTTNLVFSNSPTLVTPNLGTPSAVNLSNGTALPISTGVSGLASGMATFLNSPTSANLAATLTDETGTAGHAVFSVSPALTGTVDASGATQFKLPVAASFTTAANGEIGFDSTALNWHVWQNGADVIMAPLAAGFVSGHCAQPTSTAGVWQLADAGSACGTGNSVWSNLVSPTGNLNLNLYQTLTSPFNTTFFAGDYGVSPLTTTGAVTYSDNATNSADITPDLACVVPNTSYHDCFYGSIDGFAQLGIFATGAGHVGEVGIGSSIAYHSLSQSVPDKSKLWVMANSHPTVATIFDAHTSGFTGNVMRLSTEMAAGTAYNFLANCTSASNVDGSCSTGNATFIVRGDGQVTAANIVDSGMAGSGTQCVSVNNAGLLAGTGSACGSGGGGGVSSVGLTVNGTSPSGIFTVTGSPVTTSGTLNFNLSGTTGHFPYFSSSTVLSNNANLDDGATLSGALTYTGIFNSAPGGTNFGEFTMLGGTTNPTIPSNSVAFGGPNTATFTAYGMILPSTAPGASNVLVCGVPVSTWSTCTWTSFGGAGITNNSLTMNNSGSGAVSGSAFNGSSAVTLSYNTLGAIGGSGLTTGLIPQITGSNTIGNTSPQLDNGISFSNALTYVGAGGIIASGGPISSTSPSGDSGYFYLNGNTANQLVATNSVGWMGPTSATFTAYAIQMPSSGIGAGKLMQYGTPSSNISAASFTSTPTLGASGTAGTLSLFPASGNFQSILGSAATATNTILFPATVPGNNHSVFCNTTSTTCTLTDTGYAYNAIPNADLANSTITVNPGNVTCTLGSSCTVLLSAINAQTATYQVLASDFSNHKTIAVSAGTFTITLVASGSQPAADQYIWVTNYGSGVVTIARSGQNINGGVSSLTLSAGSSTAPTSVRIASDGTNYITDGIVGTGGGGSVSSISGDGNVITNSGSTGAVTLTLGSHWQLSGTTALTINGGVDTSGNAAQAGTTIRGANQTGAGGASSAGGFAWLTGGSNAATNVASIAGSAEISAGLSTSATTGLQGLLSSTTAYKKGATVTQWNLQCSQSTASQTQDCGATPTTIIGVAEIVNTNSVAIIYDGEAPINASAAVTLGHTVCAASTAGDITDSGGTAACSTGITIGVVKATSGTWTYPDGTSFTASTTLPLISIQGFQAGGPVTAAQVPAVNTVVDTSSPVTVSTTLNAEVHFNENATAATAMTYNLPTAAAGKQFCISNANNGSAANTGVITIATSATGQFIIFTDGTLSATGGNVTSGGAASDAACVAGVDSTHWQLYVNRGTWAKH